MEYPAYKIVKTKTLVPYAQNARLHSDAQVAVIAESIKQFKFLNPIIISGDNQIIAGHGRVLAAKLLNIEKLPCIDASHLTTDQIKAYTIADNRIAEQATWDYPILRVELDELQKHGFNINTIGFDASFMKTLRSLNTDELFTMNDKGTKQATDALDSPDDKPEREPSKTTEGYAEFTLIMETENRDRLLDVINKIMTLENLEKKEHALMMMVLSYAKKL